MKFQTLLELKLWCYNNGVDTKTRMMLTALWNDGKGGYEFDLSSHTAEKSGGDNELEAFDTLTERERAVAMGGVLDSVQTNITRSGLELRLVEPRPMPRRYSLHPLIPRHRVEIAGNIAAVRAYLGLDEGEPVTPETIHRMRGRESRNYRAGYTSGSGREFRVPVA